MSSDYELNQYLNDTFESFIQNSGDEIVENSNFNFKQENSSHVLFQSHKIESQILKRPIIKEENSVILQKSNNQIASKYLPSNINLILPDNQHQQLVNSPYKNHIQKKQQLNNRSVYFQAIENFDQKINLNSVSRSQLRKLLYNQFEKLKYSQKSSNELKLEVKNLEQKLQKLKQNNNYQQNGIQNIPIFIKFNENNRDIIPKLIPQFQEQRSFSSEQINLSQINNNSKNFIISNKQEIKDKSICNSEQQSKKMIPRFRNVQSKVKMELLNKEIQHKQQLKKLNDDAQNYVKQKESQELKNAKHQHSLSPNEIKSIVFSDNQNKQQITNGSIFFKNIQSLIMPISAKSWAVGSAISGDILYGFKLNKKREIASLTKIMTSIIVCELSKKMQINMDTTFVKVSRFASSIQGTSAGLQEGDMLNINQLLHAIYLPSGNDAAYVLAENFGVYLFYQSEDFKRMYRENPKCMEKYKLKNAASYFVEEMNKKARKLKLFNTTFANMHGLPNTLNKSTAENLIHLSLYALQFQEISNIVSKTSYLCNIKDKNNISRQIYWTNTNKLLSNNESFQGLKTGSTNSAGYCLSSFYISKNGNKLICVTLGSEDSEIRWKENEAILIWADNLISKFQIKFSNEEKTNQSKFQN